MQQTREYRVAPHTGAQFRESTAVKGKNNSPLCCPNVDTYYIMQKALGQLPFCWKTTLFLKKYTYKPLTDLGQAGAEYPQGNDKGCLDASKFDDEDVDACFLVSATLTRFFSMFQAWSFK